MTIRYAVVDPNTHLVTNAIVVDDEFELPGFLLIPTDTGGPGDTYNPTTGEFTPASSVGPTPEEIRAAMPPLSRAQVKLALFYEGITPEDVDAATEAMTDPIERQIARINWQDRNDYFRTHPLILQLAPLFGLSETKVDEMWMEAVNY